MPDTSETITKRATRARHEWDKSKSSATEVRHKCYTNDTTAAQVNNFEFYNDTNKNIISHAYIYFMAKIKEIKDHKDKNNFIVRTTFWKCFVPMPKSVWKVHHKNWSLQYRKLYQNPIHYILAASTLALPA